MDCDAQRIAQILGVIIASGEPPSVIILDRCIQAGLPKTALYNVSRALEPDPGHPAFTRIAVSDEPTVTRNARLTI